jgi:hypothetical protein
MELAVKGNTTASRVRGILSGITSRILWAIVLVVILGISAYSFYVIARHFGVPPLIAAGMSTCFDGVALLAARYSVRYAEEGLSGSGPRTAVRAFAFLSAFLQTFHARISGEPPGAFILWASLPIAAMVLYEIHIRFERKNALIRAGAAFPVPLPAYGASAWLSNPIMAARDLRAFIADRHKDIDARARTLLTRAETTEIIIPESSPLYIKPEPEPTAPRRQQRKQRSVRPGQHSARITPIREWAIQKGYTKSTHGRLRQEVIDEYHLEMGRAS